MTAKQERFVRAAITAVTMATLAGSLAPFSAIAATFTVTTLANSGAGSLRAALTSAITAAGPDVVAFAGTLSGVITLTSPLPAISGTNASATEIRGETAMDAVIGPDITIDGGAAAFDGLVVNGNADKVKIRTSIIRTRSAGAALVEEEIGRAHV